MHTADGKEDLESEKRSSEVQRACRAQEVQQAAVAAAGGGAPRLLPSTPFTSPSGLGPQAPKG